MKFLEKDLEQIIFETRNELLREKGLSISGKKVRQLRLGNYGIADIVTITKPDFIPSTEPKYNGFFEDCIYIDIYELKQDKISVSAFLQACGYYKGISTYISKHNKLKRQYKIRLNLVGKSIDTASEFIYLPDIFDDIYFYTYDYDFNGITFTHQCGYCLTNSGF